jgi:hypothetical protein
MYRIDQDWDGKISYDEWVEIFFPAILESSRVVKDYNISYGNYQDIKTINDLSIMKKINNNEDNSKLLPKTTFNTTNNEIKTKNEEEIPKVETKKYEYSNLQYSSKFMKKEVETQKNPEEEPKLKTYDYSNLKYSSKFLEKNEENKEEESEEKPEQTDLKNTYTLKYEIKKTEEEKKEEQDQKNNDDFNPDLNYKYSCKSNYLSKTSKFLRNIGTSENLIVGKKPLKLEGIDNSSKVEISKSTKLVNLTNPIKNVRVNEYLLSNKYVSPKGSKKNTTISCCMKHDGICGCYNCCHLTGKHHEVIVPY